MSLLVSHILSASQTVGDPGAMVNGLSRTGAKSVRRDRSMAVSVTAVETDPTGVRGSRADLLSLRGSGFSSWIQVK